MAQFATLAAINGNGTVYAVNAQGVSRALKVGDELLKGETIRTVGDVRVELLMEDGRLLAVAPAQSVRLDDHVVESDQRPTTQDSAVTAPATADTIIQALERGTDLNQTLDATAAGLGAGGGADGGSTFVQLLRITEGVDPLSYNYSFAAPAPTPDLQTLPLVPTDVTANITIGTIAGDNIINITEAAQPTTAVTGTVGGDVKVGDIVTLLVNGNTYTAPVTASEGGALVYSVNVNTSDLIADNTIEASVTTTNAAGTASATATTDTTIAVDINIAASITINTIAGDDIINAAENSQTNTTITGSVGGDAKVGDAVTLTVHGNTYTTSVVAGPEGTLVYSKDVLTSDLVADKNVHATVTATDPAGNTASASVDRGVTLETTTVTVSHVDAQGNLLTGNVVEGNAITFRFSVDHAPQGDLKLNVTVGGVAQTVTIASGALHGDLTVASRADENYVQGTTTVAAVVTGVDPVVNGNIPSLSFASASLSANVVDDGDVTRASITAADVTENSGGVLTFNVALSNAPQAGTSATATVQVAGEEGTRTVALDATGHGSFTVNTHGADVFADPVAVTATVTAITGGNFEATSVAGATATAHVTDVIDSTTVSVTAGNVTENDAGVTFAIT